MLTLLQIVFVSVFLQSVTCTDRPVGTKISNYENYLENLSEIGKEISCTDAEKDCFKFNRVLFTDGKCYMISHVGPCDNQELHFNKEKADNGQYVPECMPSFRCNGDASLRYMSYDQTCYHADLVNEVCDYRNNLSYSNDIYGGGHCRCFGDSCPPRPVVTQPDEPGRCRLPDQIDMFPYWNNPIYEHYFPCSAQELECFKQGKMLYEDGNCYPLLEQGPCADGHIFTGNKTVFDQLGWFVSSCSPLSCDEDSENTGRKVRMQNDGKCYLLEDVKNKLCPPHLTIFDVFGEVSCGFSDQADVSKHLPTSVSHDGKCVLSRIRF